MCSAAIDFDQQAMHIRPFRGWFDVNLRELWEYRELLYFFVCDIKIRYSHDSLLASDFTKITGLRLT